MKRMFGRECAALLLAGSCLVAAACGPVRHHAVPPTPTAVPSAMGRASPISRTDAGEQALADIKRWYNDTRADCGSAGKPAFLCSGIMLRATDSGKTFFPWDPNPSSTGVSFSYVRADVNFSLLAYTYWNGFIFYPKDLAPRGASHIAVLCSFPMDADTNSRPTLEGCGPSTQVPATSKPCDSLPTPVTTASAWLTHFTGITDKYRGQCGWDVRSGAANTADRFIQSVQAHQGLTGLWWDTQNEVRMHKWPQGSGAQLPIRAFFYVPGKSGALAKAQDDQRRYRTAYGEQMPIVRMTLPPSKGSLASFAYAASDQTSGGTDPGGPPGVMDFNDTPLGAIGTLQGDGFHVAYEGPHAPIVVAADSAMASRHLHTVDSGNVMIYLDNDFASVSFKYTGRLYIVVKTSATEKVVTPSATSGTYKYTRSGSERITYLYILALGLGATAEIDDVEVK